MGTKRSMPLHNFTMPAGLRWGNQRLLRCINVNCNGINSGGSNHHRSSDNRIGQRRATRDGERERGNGLYSGSPKVNRSQTQESDSFRRISSDDGGCGYGVGSRREGAMLDLQTAAAAAAAVDKLKDSNFKEGVEEGKVSEGNTQPCPWNLRTRRTSSKASASAIVSIASAADDGNGFRTDAPRIDSGVPQLRGAAAVTTQKCNSSAMERPKFSVTLSKRKIEEDFIAMVGRRPPRRPKKRARVVQRQLDTLFPGLWLTEVTTDMYKNPEAAP